LKLISSIEKLHDEKSELQHKIISIQEDYEDKIHEVSMCILRILFNVHHHYATKIWIDQRMSFDASRKIDVF